MAILDVQHIEKGLSGLPGVLEDISFSLEQGQALAIIGSSGSRQDHAAAVPELPGDPGPGDHLRPGGDPL